MTTKFDAGDLIFLQIKGRVKRIQIDDNGEVLYTITTNDGLGKESYVYFDEKDLQNAVKIEEG